VGAEVSGEDDLWLRYLGHVPHLANQMFSYGCLVLKTTKQHNFKPEQKVSREKTNLY